MLNILLNLLLFTLKFIGGKITHSVAIVSDAFNNLTDAVTTFFAFIGVKISSMGAGEHHPNGHGRLDWIIALVSSISVILVGWELFGSSLDAVKSPDNQVFSIFTLIVLIASIGIKFFMYVYNQNKGKKSSSQSLKAIAADCLSDAVSTTIVLVSFVVYSLFKVNIDGYCGVVVSLFIMYNGFSSCMETVELIMGQSASKENLDELNSLIMKHGCISSVENLQIENYGSNRFNVYGTIVYKKDVSAERIISEVAQIKLAVYEKYGYKSVFAIEPQQELDSEISLFIDAMLHTLPVRLKKVSARMIPSDTQKIVMLKLALSHDDCMQMAQVEAELKQKINGAPPEYRIVLDLTLSRDHYQHRKHVCNSSLS